MKIAVCFSGQPRFVDYAFPYIKHNVFLDNNIDVFAHLWFDDDLTSKPYKYGGNGTWQHQRIEKNAIEVFKTLYNPVALKSEPSKKFKISSLEETYDISCRKYKQGSINNPLEPNFYERDINNIFSYYYSLNQVCLLKKEYEYLHNFKYDVVIRLRTDAVVFTPINQHKIKDNTLYYSDNQKQPDGMINDWLNFGTSKTMDAFTGCFSILEYLIEDCKKQTDGAWCCELIHKKMMEKMGIDSCGLNIEIHLPRF
jgi:hypothetical protein